MQTNDPIGKKILIDFDVTMSFGAILPITIDESLGDRFYVTKDTLNFEIAAKPSQADPEVNTPAENITVYTSHIACIQRREREVIELTPEQKFEQKQLFKQWATVQ